MLLTLSAREKSAGIEVVRKPTCRIASVRITD